MRPARLPSITTLSQSSSLNRSARPTFITLFVSILSLRVPAKTVFQSIIELYFYVSRGMVSQGHQHSASLSVNQKAQLANAYNELGKELSSQKIRVVGNYTLGRVIGEGKLFYIMVRQTSRLISPRRFVRYCPYRHPSSYLNSCCHQTNPKSNVCPADA